MMISVKGEIEHGKGRGSGVLGKVCNLKCDDQSRFHCEVLFGQRL